MFLLKKSLIITIFFFLLITFTSCGIYKKAPIKDIPVSADARVQKNIEEGRGVKFGDKRNKQGGVASFAAANPMWQAALETLDFMILSSADYGGGIIITDWYSDANDNEFIKITIRFLSDEIRADGIKITIHEKKCDNQQNSKINRIQSDLASEIKLSILQKAVLIDKKITKKRVEEFKKQFPKKKVKSDRKK